MDLLDAEKADRVAEVIRAHGAHGRFGNDLEGKIGALLHGGQPRFQARGVMGDGDRLRVIINRAMEDAIIHVRDIWRSVELTEAEMSSPDAGIGAFGEQIRFW